MLRGGSFATDPVACRGTFRNWDYPIRRQIFAGFRTARDARRGGRLMCRHLAYLGPAGHAAVAALRPAARPGARSPGRRGGSGTARSTPTASASAGTPHGDPSPARYRRAGPIWTDPSFADLAAGHPQRGGARRGPVGHAPGTEPGEAGGRAVRRRPLAVQPQRASLAGWPGSAAGAALPRCRAARPARAGGPVRLGAAVGAACGTGSGREPRRARRSPARRRTWPRSGRSGRLNLLLTDGETIAATAAGDTLCYRAGPGRVLVASEPCDDEPGWTEVPDGSLLEATAAGVRSPRSAPGRASRAHAHRQRR